MILFVFEGKKREPYLFETIKLIFLPKETESFVCTYNSNIYSLYSKLKGYDVFKDIKSSGNTVSVLNDILQEKNDNTLEHISDTDISEIFLFFDYDFHDNRMPLEENNRHIQEMLCYFNEETENGKMYINYPMVESIRYTKKLPDNEYWHYTINRAQCSEFKKIANGFSYYDSFDYLLISNNDNESADKRLKQFETAKRHWLHLIDMNVEKANYLCSGLVDYPIMKSDIAQVKIFKSQLTNYVTGEVCMVSILNAFPIFLYEYLKFVRK